ncbi:MAG: hypothetical protein M1816_001679 [Peltula sp. TS41687]|nr:MAG: hypothetical protein M1816_001679 [Peltula sp. TS41687]
MQHILHTFAGLASMAAAAALNAEKTENDALRLLELGRAVIAGLALEIHQYPELAREFEYIRDELDSPADVANPLISIAITPSLSSRTRSRVAAGPELEKVIEKIRAKPGFEEFLQPPTEKELMAAAVSGPIVTINTSSYRCDALLIESHRIRSLNLLDPNEEEIIHNVNGLGSKALDLAVASMLEWLWKVAAGPVLEALHAPLTLLDEGINLINACQFAGFRHVMGTLWEVDDKSQVLC